MKKIFFLISLFLLTELASAQFLNKNFEEVFFEKPAFNLGMIDRTNGIVEKEILLVNGSKNTVEILLSNTSCFCLTATPVEKKIKPESSIKVNLKFLPQVGGQFNYKVFVNYRIGDVNSKTVLVVNGNVLLTAEETEEEVAFFKIRPFKSKKIDAIQSLEKSYAFEKFVKDNTQIIEHDGFTNISITFNKAKTFFNEAYIQKLDVETKQKILKELNKYGMYSHRITFQSKTIDNPNVDEFVKIEALDYNDDFIKESKFFYPEKGNYKQESSLDINEILFREEIMDSYTKLNSTTIKLNSKEKDFERFVGGSRRAIMAIGSAHVLLKASRIGTVDEKEKILKDIEKQFKKLRKKYTKILLKEGVDESVISFEEATIYIIDPLKLKDSENKADFNFWQISIIKK